jgi:hypothetical protein
VKRLKYIKLNDNVFTTEGNVRTYAKGDVRVFFDISDMSFRIESAKGTEIIFSGKATSPHKIKIKVKNELIKLGAFFEQERRQPRA